MIQEMIKNTPNAAFERARFFSYRDFSLTCEVVYYVIGSDHNLYMDLQQRINLETKRAFEKEDIEFLIQPKPCISIPFQGMISPRIR